MAINSALLSGRLIIAAAYPPCTGPLPRRGGTFLGDGLFGTKWSGLVVCTRTLLVLVATTPLPDPHQHRLAGKSQPRPVVRPLLRPRLTGYGRTGGDDRRRIPLSRRITSTQHPWMPAGTEPF